MPRDFSGFQKQIMGVSNLEQLETTRNSLNILIVDDDEQNRRMLELILRNSGHTVKFGGNGMDALQIVQSDEFDLVLMDVQMPLMNGFEATRQIRKWETGEVGRRRLAIIGLTAILESEYRNCLQAGMDGIISKPFDIQQFYTMIAVHVDQKRISTENIIEITKGQSVNLDILDVKGSVKRFAGDEENYLTLLDEFILSLPGKFEELVNDYEAGDWNSLSNHAHNLKGLAASFGVKELSRKALALEQYVNENQFVQAKQKLNDVEISIQNLRTEASIFLNNFFSNKDKSA